MESLTAFAPIIWGAVSLGIGWLAKEIIKPWSETWRLKIVAEAEHMRKVDEALVLMVQESRKHTDSLSGIDDKMSQNNATLAQMRTENVSICKAGEVATKAQLDELIREVKVLQRQNVDAAKALEDKAVLIAVPVEEKPKDGGTQ